MTLLLISVTNSLEAQIAIDNGADIIDLKNPASGALGALPLQQIESILKTVNHQKKVSATIGDEPLEPKVIAEKVAQLMKLKLDYIKIGFFEINGINQLQLSDCLNSLTRLVHKGANLIAVLFAEYQYPVTLVADLKKAGFIGAMLDTVNKNGLTLFDHASEERLNTFVKHNAELSLISGLAGSININHVDRLVAINPNYIGFRGGVCEERLRTGNLSGQKIKDICKRL
jgi:(5-formylfuran-3-yl)methyl phosphate synthase